jgi:hypothetical protein
VQEAGEAMAATAVVVEEEDMVVTAEAIAEEVGEDLAATAVAAVAAAVAARTARLVAAASAAATRAAASGAAGGNFWKVLEYKKQKRKGRTSKKVKKSRRLFCVSSFFYVPSLFYFSFVCVWRVLYTSTVIIPGRRIYHRLIGTLEQPRLPPRVSLVKTPLT